MITFEDTSRFDIQKKKTVGHDLLLQIQVTGEEQKIQHVKDVVKG